MKNIKEFKSGDRITKVKPSLYYVDWQGNQRNDRSYIGQELEFMGVANGKIYLKQTVGENIRLDLDFDIYSEGWDYYVNPDELEKKDPWYGVEFAKIGKVHKIKSMDKLRIHFNSETWAYKDKCDPSTEAEYVNQLKEELSKRFGNLDVNDLDCSELGEKLTFGFNPYLYIKETDTLYHYTTPVYQQGKWVKKKRVEVEFDSFNLRGMYGISFIFNSNKEYKSMDQINKAGHFLASQLEKYLNDEK